MSRVWVNLDPGLWIQEQSFKMLGAEIGGRTTAVQLANGNLWLHAPGAAFADGYRELCELGVVKYLVAPNAFHHLYLSKARELFPRAELWGPGAVQKKQPTLSLQRLDQTLPESWAPALETVSLKGSKLQEYVFFHRPSKTLIVTDLIFNLHPQDLKSRLLTSLTGTHKGLACSRLVRLSVTDRSAFRSSLEEIYAWDFERIVMSHGEVLPEHGREQLQKLMQWV